MSIFIVNTCTLQNKLGWSVAGEGGWIYFVYASNKHMLIVRDPIHILRVHVSYGKYSGHMYNVMYLLSPVVRVAYDGHHHA